MRYALLCCLLLLAACDNLQQLRTATPSGTPFQNALSKRYMDYANGQEKSRWFDAEHFAGKGLKAAHGVDVAPEDPKDWAIAKEAMPDMEIGHDKLIAVLSVEAKDGDPQAAADAQFNYDCWVDQQANDPAGNMLAQCRDGFFAALDKLGGNSPMAQVLNPVDKPTDMVFFEWDKSNLTEEGEAILKKEIAALLQDKKDYTITLGGHTDTTGSAKYNLKLSQLRAETVRDELVAGGIDTDRIKIFAYGKSDPLIKTGDNVREPRNRRVEIFIAE